MPPAIMRDDDLLKQRLDDAISADSKYGGWPDKLEVVDVRMCDPTNPMQMHELGLLVGRSRVTRRVAYKAFSYANTGYDNEDKPLVKVRQMFPAEAWRGDSVTFHFSVVYPHGQEDDITKRNIYAVVDAPTKWNGIFSRNDFIGHGLIVTIGCVHDYDDAGSNHNRGYHKGRCRKCGHQFMVDSSD